MKITSNKYKKHFALFPVFAIDAGSDYDQNKQAYYDGNIHLVWLEFVERKAIFIKEGKSWIGKRRYFYRLIN